MRRGQAALEYLVTYGWAFLAILVVMGALVYLGFLSPSRYLPSRCDFGVQLECIDYQLTTEGANGAVWVKFQNNFGDDVNLTRAWVSGGLRVQMQWHSGGFGIFNSPPVHIEKSNSSANIRMLIDASDSMVLVGGERMSVPLTIEFRRDRPGSPLHTISGEVFATVQE